MYEAPAAWHALMDSARPTPPPTYLNGQIDAGAQAVQLFDSWVGALSPDDYRAYVLPHTRVGHPTRCARGRRSSTSAPAPPTLLPLMREAGGDVIGLDWRIDLDRGWDGVGHDVGVQGNLDPAVLLADAGDDARARARDPRPAPPGARATSSTWATASTSSTPVDHVRALVDMVHELSAR